MNNQVKEILGSTLSAIGTIEAAIANTPQFRLNEAQTFFHHLVGNVLQALGSALSADGQGSISFERLGDQLQAAGNTTVVTGIFLYAKKDKDAEQRLSITGTWMQALGSFIGVIDEFFDNTVDGRFENISGGLLQGIGNSMQALGGIEELQKNTSVPVPITTWGSWTQATGSVLSLIGQIQEEREEKKRSVNE